MKNLELKMAKLRLEGLRNTAEYTNLEKELASLKEARNTKLLNNNTLTDIKVVKNYWTTLTIKESVNRNTIIETVKELATTLVGEITIYFSNHDRISVYNNGDVYHIVFNAIRDRELRAFISETLEKEVVNQPHVSEQEAFEVKKENNRKGLDALTLELIGVNKHSNNSIVFACIEYTIETLKDLKEVSEIVFIENELNGVTLGQVKRLIKNLFPEIEEKETQIENTLLANEPINTEQFNFYKQELIEQDYKYFVVDNNKRKSLSVYPCFDLEVAGIIRDNCNDFLVLLEWDTAWETFKNIFHF